MQDVTGYSHDLERDQDQPREHDVVYAGFWRRWAALFLDQLILGVAFYGLIFVLAIVAGVAGGLGWLESVDAEDPPTWAIVAYLAFIASYYVAAGLYYSLMESSRHQATLGKMALGIKVVDERGQRLSFGHALGRWFAAALSYLTLYAGFLMAAFTERKRALHDMAAGTLVVDRWAWTEHPERQRRELGGCLIAIIIAAMLTVLLSIVAILAAIAIPAYHQYVQRVKVAQVVAETAGLRLAIAEFRQNEGRCPIDGEDALGSHLGQGGAHVARLTMGEFEGGGCGIELELGGTGDPGLDDGRLWWELEPDGRWTCSSSVEDHLLPMECRG